MSISAPDDVPGIFRMREFGPAAEPDLAEMVRRLRRRLWIERGVFLALLATLGAVTLGPALFPRVWAVYVGDRPVVALRDKTAALALLEQVKREQGEGSSGVTFAQPVRVDQADPARVPVADARTAAQRVAGAVKLRAERAMIYIDGAPVAALPDAAQANEVLERLKAELGGKLERIDQAPAFKQQVDVRVEPAEQDAWADMEAALGLLRGDGADEEATHVVTPGDNGWSIARKYRLSVDALRTLNPEAHFDRLRVGQRLHVRAPAAPLLTVVAEGRETEEIPLSYDTIIRQAPAMFTGKRILRQPGRPGRQRVTYRVKLENARVVERQEISRERVEAPRPKIVIHGAKPRPGRA